MKRYTESDTATLSMKNLGQFGKILVQQY